MSVLSEWGMCCPSCRDDDDLHVTFIGVCKLFSDGTEDEGDHEWDSTSKCYCGCGWTGTVAEAESAGAEEEEDA